MKAPAVLRVELRRSRLAIAFVGVASIATAALVAWLPGNEWIRAAVALAAGMQGIATLRSWGMRVSPHAIAVIEIDSDRRAVLTERGGRRIEGIVRADCYVGALLTTLVIRPENARYSRAEAILPDMMRTEDFRRLRMLLRFGKLPDDASGS